MLSLRKQLKHNSQQTLPLFYTAQVKDMNSSLINQKLIIKAETFFIDALSSCQPKNDIHVNKWPIRVVCATQMSQVVGKLVSEYAKSGIICVEYLSMYQNS